MPEVCVDQVGPGHHINFCEILDFLTALRTQRRPQSAFAPVKWVTRIWCADRTTEAWLTGSGYTSGERKGAPRTPLRLPRLHFYKRAGAFPPHFTLSFSFPPTPFPSPLPLLLSSSPPGPPWLLLGQPSLKS